MFENNEGKRNKARMTKWNSKTCPGTLEPIKAQDGNADSGIRERPQGCPLRVLNCGVLAGCWLDAGWLLSGFWRIACWLLANVWLVDGRLRADWVPAHCWLTDGRLLDGSWPAARLLKEPYNEGPLK